MKKVGQLFRENSVESIKKSIDKNENVFLLSYSNLSGPVINDLRKNLKSAGAEVCVSRNSIARLALQGLKQDHLAERVEGQTAFVWSTADSSSISKILVEFMEECESFKIQGGLLDGRILEKHQVKALAELPSRAVLLSMLLSTIQAPLTRLAGVFNAKSQELLSVLKQLAEKKGGS